MRAQRFPPITPHAGPTSGSNPMWIQVRPTTYSCAADKIPNPTAINLHYSARRRYTKAMHREIVSCKITSTPIQYNAKRFVLCSVFYDASLMICLKLYGAKRIPSARKNLFWNSTQCKRRACKKHSNTSIMSNTPKVTPAKTP
jgi:hypothetical protein